MRTVVITMFIIDNSIHCIVLYNWLNLRREFVNPFQEQGNWYRGNIHAHTTLSDGTKNPKELVEIYKQAGYDFLSVTDHSIVAKLSHLSSEDFLLVPGEEICVGLSQAKTLYHIVALGIEDTLPFKDFDYEIDPQIVINKIKELGGLAIIAHPYWSGLNHEDLMKVKDYHGIEIYNTSCDFERNLGYSDAHVDGVIAEGVKPLIYATDDHHGAEMGNAPLDAAVAWICVKAENLSLECLMDSLIKGHFYSSTGPEIKNICLDEDGVIKMECSPVKSISFISTPSLGLKFHSKDVPLTKAEYPGRLGETYVRIELEDFFGKKAWSNPFYNIE
jgi:predicted metal-dependent phosphoesterase TrpH